MIDVSKCEFEESFRQEEFGYDVYYFTYPKDMTETEFDVDEEKVAFMTLCITVHDGGLVTMQMSPTVEDEDGYSDVDWRDLYLGINFSGETVVSLLSKAGVLSVPAAAACDIGVDVVCPITNATTDAYSIRKFGVKHG